MEEKQNRPIFTLDVRKLQNSPKNFFFSLKFSSLNRYKMETHHFYLNQRHFFFSLSLFLKPLDLYIEAPIQIKRKTALIYYAVHSHYVLPRNQSCPCQTCFHRTLWSGSSSQHQASCFAWLIPSVEGSAAFSHNRNPAARFPWSSTEKWGVSSLNGLSSCQVPKCSRPSLKMLNICSFPKTSGYLVWVTPSLGWWVVWKQIIPVKNV